MESIKITIYIISFEYVAVGIDKKNKPIYPNHPFLIYKEAGKVDCKNNKLSINGSEFRTIALNWANWIKVKNYVCE